MCNKCIVDVVTLHVLGTEVQKKRFFQLIVGLKHFVPQWSCTRALMDFITAQLEKTCPTKAGLIYVEKQALIFICISSENLIFMNR